MQAAATQRQGASRFGVGKFASVGRTSPRFSTHRAAWLVLGIRRRFTQRTGFSVVQVRCFGSRALSNMLKTALRRWFRLWGESSGSFLVRSWSRRSAKSPAVPAFSSWSRSSPRCFSRKGSTRAFMYPRRAEPYRAHHQSSSSPNVRLSLAAGSSPSRWRQAWRSLSWAKAVASAFARADVTLWTRRPSGPFHIAYHREPRFVTDAIRLVLLPRSLATGPTRAVRVDPGAELTRYKPETPASEPPDRERPVLGLVVDPAHAALQVARRGANVPELVVGWQRRGPWRLRRRPWDAAGPGETLASRAGARSGLPGAFPEACWPTRTSPGRDSSRPSFAPSTGLPRAPMTPVGTASARSSAGARRAPRPRSGPSSRSPAGRGRSPRTRPGARVAGRPAGCGR